jgi:isopentenyl phosphate kinase
MTQAELKRQVARATGETLGTVAAMGFVPLTHGPVERDRKPLVVDGDELDESRAVLYLV